ncbi:MAG TPA: CehA/McbA family metallohydrolase [Kofleriaceae bacterium]
MNRAAAALAALACGCGDHPAPPRPAADAPAQAPGLVLRVTADGVPAAARVLLVDAHGDPLRFGTIDLFGQRQGPAACRVTADVTATWDGIIVGKGSAELPVGPRGDDTCKPPAVPPGHYHVVAWRGLEFERWERDVDLRAGVRTELDIALERAWRAPGTLAADLHVHAYHSDDSNIAEESRVLSLAAAGVQVAGEANHNHADTFAPAIATQHLGAVLAAVPDVELTSDWTHVNVYPAALDHPIDWDATVDAKPDALLAQARAFPGDPIVQVNHPRFRVTALFDTLGWDGFAWPPPFPHNFDAVEVLNGFDAFSAPGDHREAQCAHDFFELTDRGWLVAPMGNSDSHDYNWVLDGTARTYVYVPDARTEPFDQAAFIAAIRARRTVATTGPWLDLDVGGAKPGGHVVARGTVHVTISVRQARFSRADHLRIWIGTDAGPREARTLVLTGSPFTWSGEIPVGARDTWVGATVDGDTILPEEQTGTYQRDKWNRAGVAPFAIASPVLVDVDGDGRWKRGAADLAL